jgi:probable addiction module antidote protein
MNATKFNPDDMPILDLDTSGTSAYEASRFLDNPQIISAYLAESLKAQDPQLFMQALAEVAKAQGVNKVAQQAGVNRESLYKSLKGGAKTRFETIQKLMNALGVELTVQPVATAGPKAKSAKRTASCARKPTAGKLAVEVKRAN